MAARSANGLTRRLAQIAAIFAFIFAQSVSTAHAGEDHGDHDEHAPEEVCVVCSVAFADDDDLDAPAEECAEIVRRPASKDNPSSTSKSLIGVEHCYAVIRGPPHN